MRKRFCAKIDFYSMTGKVMETIYYYSYEAYKKEIFESCDIGRPIEPKILKVTLKEKKLK